MATTTSACIEGDIKQSSLLLPNFPAQQKAASPHFRLPPETLADIFIHAARDYQYHEIKAGRTTLRVPDWVNASYVCRHWRDAALNCPTLWSYHFIVSLRWTEELLTRSQQTLLKMSICFGLGRPIAWWARLVGRVLDHAERIQELHLDIPGTVVPTTLSLSPHLTILDIRLWSGRCTLTVNDGEIPPKLCDLILAGCSFPWNSLDLSGITTLSLFDLPTQFQQNIGEFLAMLTRMQALSTLHLEFPLPDARVFLSGGAPGVSPAILPNLACLSVVAPLFTVLTLLSFTKIPLEAHVRVQIQLEDDGPSSVEDYAQIPVVLKQRFSRFQGAPPSCPTIRSLVIRFPLSGPSTFTFSALEHGDCDPHLLMPHALQSCSISLMLDVSVDPLVMTSSDKAHILCDICCSIPSTHVEKLHIIRPPTRLPDFWSKILGHLDGLRCIKLSDSPMPDLVSLLTAINGRPPRGGVAANRVLVPALEELQLHRIAFASKFSRIGVSRQSLLDALATRKALQPRLTTTECT